MQPHQLRAFVVAALWCSICESARAVTPVTVKVMGDAVAGRTAAGLVSFNFDWHKDSEESPAWIGSSVQVVDLNNPLLRATARALAPAHLRVGGSEGDQIVYAVTGSECGATVDPAFCLNMTRWRELVAFCQDVGCQLVFGLNGMTRLNDTSPLNLTNHEAFLAYTAANHLPVVGFEIGNELPKVDPVVMGKDYLAVKALLTKYWPSNTPLLIGNDLNTNGGYLDRFLPVVGPALDVVTYHNYVGYGLDPNLSREVVTPEFLDEGPARAQEVIEAWQKHAPHAQIWVGEIAAAWHSGRDGVTNAFESSFWFADALAALALRNHTGFCRQTLRGGWYGLLNTTTYLPNPDYYTASLFHDLMGDDVLAAHSPVPTLRVYAHCSRKGTGIALLLLNIDPAATFSVSLENHSLINLTPRNEYVLSAGDLASHVVALNGEPLVAHLNGTLPVLNPQHVDQPTPLELQPFTLAFVHLPEADVAACKQ